MKSKKYYNKRIREEKINKKKEMEKRDKRIRSQEPELKKEEN